jgi:hypothetical protein
MANGNIAGNFGLGSFNLEPFPQGLNPITGLPLGHTYEQASTDGIAGLPYIDVNNPNPYAYGETQPTVSTTAQEGEIPYIPPVDTSVVIDGGGTGSSYGTGSYGTGVGYTGPGGGDTGIGGDTGGGSTGGGTVINGGGSTGGGTVINGGGSDTGGGVDDLDTGEGDEGGDDIGGYEGGDDTGGGTEDTNAAAIAELNAQIAALQAQLADANSLYATATTEHEQALAAQQATALTEQQAALEALKQSMLGERGGFLEEQKQTMLQEREGLLEALKQNMLGEREGLLESQKQSMLGEREGLLEAQKQAMLGEREALLAEAQTAADIRIAEIQAELEAQATVKAEEIAALEAQLAALGEQLAAAKATAEEYKLLAGENSEIGAVAAAEAEARYNALLAEYNSLTLQLSESQQQHNALIDESAAVFDQSIVDAQNRETEYTMIDDTGILVDVENTYLAPTDLYKDAALQRIKEQAASAPAQALAISQYNAFADLLGKEKIDTDTGGGDTGGGDTGGGDTGGGDTGGGDTGGGDTGGGDTTQEFTYQTIYDNFVNNPQYFDLLGIDAGATYDEWLEAWQKYMSNIEGLGF